MKNKFFLISILIAFSFFNAGFTKEHVNTAPRTPQAILPSDVLTGKKWQPAELRALETNTTYYYKRGTAGKWNLDDEYVLFNKDMTGTYGDASGITYPLTWSFRNSKKTALRFIIQYSIPLTVNWEGMIYSSTKIVYTQYLTRSNGTNSLASGYRIPKYF